MANVEARLQAALGDTYHLEREIGRGGNATVYLAHDRKHDRQVALKALLPELAETVGAGRFLREIQIAAHLTHPHILPVYDSGEAGGCLYYVMPYVEGESLRDRLTRERQLPLSDALQIAREVADALSYAHQHDVVHRDIKPENILLQAGHAVVADFGIARALGAPTGQAVTQTGIAVGTPTYMSPEQGVGSATLDGRSDVYSLGCVIYEMLAGRPPFDRSGLQATLAAHAFQTPPPVATYRPDLPPAVGALVGRCLAKQPEDRWPGAAQLVRALETIATPAGGGAPSAPRDRHPLRVAAWFAVVGAGAFAVVHGLVLGLGLPYWVEHATAVLLVAGLPLTLLAGVAERRQRGGTAVGMVRWLTWPRVRTAGAVMFGGLGTVTLSYAVMRHLGIGPPATLEARGKLGARDPVVLAEFMNRTTDSTLGPTLTEALRVDLSQSRAVTLADPQAVAATLERMERAPTLPLTLPLAREVARRSGAKAVVTGEIDPAGTGFVLSARVLAAADGQVLTAVRADAADDGHLLAALDQLSAGLRERIGESLRSVRASPPLADVTTASLDALAKYSEGARAVDLGDFERGIGLLRQATVLDTGFAMAYRKLAAGLDNIGAPLGDRVEAVTHAYAHRDRLTEIERLLAAAYYHTEIMFDLAAAETEYRAALDIEPTNPIALNNLALVLNNQRRWAAADTFAQRAVAGDSATDAHYANAVKAEAAEGHYAEAEATLAHLSRAEPQSALAPGLEGLLAVAQGRFPVAEQQFRRSAELERAGSMGAAHMAEIRVGLDEAQGHLARAEADVRAFMAAADARGLARDYLLGAIAAGWIDLTYRDRRDAALARVAGALRHHPLASIPPLDRPYPELAEFYAASGHVAEAAPLLAEFQRAVPAGLRRGQPERFAAAGAIALAQGRWRDAVAGYRAAYDSSDCTACGWFEIGMAYERDRQPDSAIAAYERILGTPGLPYDDVRPYAPPLASLRLGELYERRRDRPRAIGAYTRFVDFWKDGDPELQPTVRDARQRLARLAGEH